MISEEIIKAIKKASGEDGVKLETPVLPEHGDFSTNIAMQASKKEGNPKDLAEKIASKLKKDKDLEKYVEKIEVAGPGFINFWLSREHLLGNLGTVLQEKEKYGASDLGKSKTVVVEYSSPNIAREFSIGHLRSTIIGQALYNIFDFLGYKTIGDNHLGDWGTQFGMIIAQVVRRNLDPNSLTVEDYQKLYVEFNKEAKDNPELQEEARSWFKKLEDGDKKARDVWQAAKDISLKEFDRIYRLIDVKIDNAYGESFYEDKMPPIIKEVRRKGLSKKSEGAEIVEFKNIEAPAVLLKSDGATTYYTRDLATVKFRVSKWKPSKIIYEVGAEQKLHFRQIFETARLMGWAKGTKLVHVAHGLVLFGKKKMSTRKGNVVFLEELLNDSIKKAMGIIEKSETSRGLSNKEKQGVAQVVGIGAVKYWDLSHHPESTIEFDWEKLFTLEGNSAPYLQYTCARASSVLAKSKTRVQKAEFKSTKPNKNEERSLLRAFVQLQGVVIDAAESYSPNLLTNYLFDLAQKYNAFYNAHKIIGSDDEEFKLALTAATAQILTNGLKLLGIKTPQKM
jgi:arginyl-tRNA synthetase